MARRGTTPKRTPTSESPDSGRGDLGSQETAAGGARQGSPSKEYGPDYLDQLAGDAALDLLERCRHGDPEAFDRLVIAWRPRMVQFFFRLCWDRHRSEDLAQDFFVKLLRAARRYRPEGRLGTFLYRIATNLWIDHYRAQKPRPRLYSLEQPVFSDPEGSSAPGHEQHREPTPEARVEHEEERALLRSALENLTEPHRLVFELAVYQEMPYGRVSEVLGIPVGTVKSRMHNAVRALREVLDGGTPGKGELPSGGFRFGGGLSAGGRG